MSRKLDWYSSQARRLGEGSLFAYLARVLGHTSKPGDCLARRYGHCPGTDLCHDCPWSEGTSRETA